MPTESVVKTPPRNGLVRAQPSGVQFVVRETNGTRGGPTLFGHFARFNEWTEIDSLLEGRFMESIAPGAFRTAFKTPDRIRVLFQHGRDPQVGDKPIAAPDVLREDDSGAYYESPLFTGLPDLVLEGLRNNQYGASFRFRVLRDRFEDNPGESEHNPLGLPERTIIEAQVPEFGPVTFPAYWGASAGMRSMTDEFVLQGLSEADPEMVRMAAQGIDLAAAFRDQQEDIADDFRKRRRRQPPKQAEVRAATPSAEGERTDYSDVMCLTTMIDCGARFIAMQDDSDEQPLVDQMKAVLHQLTTLLDGEIDEDESSEGGGYPFGYYSKEEGGEERDTAPTTQPQPPPPPQPTPGTPPSQPAPPPPGPAPTQETSDAAEEPVVAQNGGRNDNAAAAQGLRPTPLYRPTIGKRRDPFQL